VKARYSDIRRTLLATHYLKPETCTPGYFKDRFQVSGSTSFVTRHSSHFPGVYQTGEV
jgi:hypothetical protein